jgi:hypothetical protein
MKIAEVVHHRGAEARRFFDREGSGRKKLCALGASAVKNPADLVQGLMKHYAEN